MNVPPEIVRFRPSTQIAPPLAVEALFSKTPSLMVSVFEPVSADAVPMALPLTPVERFLNVRPLNVMSAASVIVKIRNVSPSKVMRPSPSMTSPSWVEVRMKPSPSTCIVPSPGMNMTVVLVRSLP